MEDRKSVPHAGSIRTALERARLHFMANGFRIDQPSETELIITGQGMYSTKQNPITGISKARIIVSENAIDIIAEFKDMQRFLFIFPTALAGCLVIIFACIPRFPKHAPFIAFTPLLQKPEGFRAKAPRVPP
jgi:hypothetical protein